MNDDERAGYRHLIRFPSDGRELADAIERFAAADRQDLFPELLRIACLFGLTRSVRTLRARLGLPVDDVEFSRWFRTHGIFWFDVYREDELAYVLDEDVDLHRQLAEDWSDALARAEADDNISPTRTALLRKFAAGEDPVVLAAAPRRVDVDARFRRHCEARGIEILRKFQDGVSGLNRRCWVYLAIDEDGLAKVFKELPYDDDNRLGRLPTEPEIYARLGIIPDTPRFYGTIDLDDGLVFAKMSVCHGQTLADYVWTGNLLAKDEVCHVIARLASILKDVHAAGVLYLDLRPENVVFEPERVQLFDFNASRFAESGEIDTCPFDPRYAAPETSLRFRASFATDVFQLGVMFHYLLTGAHPFVSEPGIPTERGDSLEKFATASAFNPYLGRLDLELNDPRLAIIARMLEKRPEDRPTMTEVAATLVSDAPSIIRQKSHRVPKTWERNAVLFPARMGIPHKGHIDYLARVLGLGFHPIISLQRSYTLTERDPLPKWIVMKMVMQSLFDRGFGPNDVRFVFTPFYETPEEMKMHFAMMPGMEDVVAVVSSNPGMREMFDRLPIIEQRVVFGLEGEAYEDRSWGEDLRRSVREGDHKTFLRYAASGVERILSFEELRTRQEPHIEFVRGSARVILVDEDGSLLVEGRTRRYASPEECLVQLLRERGEDVTLIDPFAKNAVLRRQGSECLLRYTRTELTEKYPRVHYALSAL
ncbi:MAG: protein kinase [Patescibacteria group bacterium]|jgi:hypothetical protein